MRRSDVLLFRQPPSCRLQPLHLFLFIFDLFERLDDEGDVALLASKQKPVLVRFVGDDWASEVQGVM